MNEPTKSKQDPAVGIDSRRMVPDGLASEIIGQATSCRLGQVAAARANAGAQYAWDWYPSPGTTHASGP